ncbi:hypothetical protein Tco_0280099, partial [Tanacetum coccineum]
DYNHKAYLLVTRMEPAAALAPGRLRE